MTRIVFLSLWILLLIFSFSLTAQETKPSNIIVDAKADQIFQQMGVFLAKTKEFGFTAYKMTDFVMESGQKIQLSEVTQIVVSRPNKIRGHTKGDLNNERVWYNGKTVSVYNAEQNTYGQVKVPDNIDAMMDFIVEKYGVSLPLADLVFSDPYKTAMEKVRVGQYVGLHYVKNVKCHHLAFRQEGLDWQLWIEEGPRPLPRKLVITYKELPGHPQFIALLDDWNLSPKLTKNYFEFQPPAGAKKIEIQTIAEKIQQNVNLQKK